MEVRDPARMQADLSNLRCGPGLPETLTVAHVPTCTETCRSSLDSGHSDHADVFYGWTPDCPGIQRFLAEAAKVL